MPIKAPSWPTIHKKAREKGLQVSLFNNPELYLIKIGQPGAIYCISIFTEIPRLKEYEYRRIVYAILENMP